MIEAKLSVKEFLDYGREKAAKDSSFLTRMMSNIEEPKSSCRQLTAVVVKFILLYTAPV